MRPGLLGFVLVLLLTGCSGGVERAAHCRRVPEFDLWATDLDGNVTRLTDEAGGRRFRRLVARRGADRLCRQSGRQL